MRPRRETARPTAHLVGRQPTVHLVGAGPGDPELLTLKAARLLAEADILVHDRLVGAGVLALARPQARRIDVGKATGAHRLSQTAINRLLVELARPGRTLVRLKGGDPFIFGRGGEELLHLVRHGIRVEVVPGITAASGCAAALGLPLTQRGLASGVRLVTGHGRDGIWPELDWQGLADPDTTLVVYMGLAHAAAIADRLIAAGLPPGTPAIVVEAGTTARERRVRATLAGLAPALQEEPLQPPALLVIGRVVELLDAAAEAAARPAAARPVDTLLTQLLHA